MENVDTDAGFEKQNVRSKMVTTAGKLLKVLGIKTKRKDNVHKNSLGSLFLPYEDVRNPFPICHFRKQRKSFRYTVSARQIQ